MAEIKVQVNLPPKKPKEGTLTAEALQGILGEATRRMGHDYPKDELWVIDVNHGDNYFDIRDQAGLVLSRRPAQDPRAYKYLRPGDVVLVGFAGRNRDRSYIKGRSSVGWVTLRPAYLRGLWDQGQAHPGLTYMGQAKMSPITMTSEDSSSWPSTAPHPTDTANGILGLVVFPRESDAQAVVCFLYQEDEGSTHQLRLAAWLVNGLKFLWDVALAGSSYASGGSPVLNDHLFYDRVNRTLNVIGYGSAARHKQIWVLSEKGKPIATASAPASMLQSTYFNNIWIKTWVRLDTENDYESVDKFIRAYRRQGKIIDPLWQVDAQALLPGCQIASSSSSQPASRAPSDPAALDSVGSLCLWTSGVEAYLDTSRGPISQFNLVMASGVGYQRVTCSSFPSGFTLPLAPSLIRTLPPFAAHQVQRARLSFFSADSGQVAYKYEISFAVSEAIQDTVSINSWNSYHASRGGSFGSDIVVPEVEGFSGIRLQGFSGSITATYHYIGFAAQNSLSLVSPGEVLAGRDGPPLPDAGDPPVPVTKIGVWRYRGGYGYSEDYCSGTTTLFDLTTAPTPFYSYLLGSHIRLHPLPGTTAPEGTLGEDALAPHDLALTTTPQSAEWQRLDPVGGVSCIDTDGVGWAAYTRPTNPIILGSASLVSQMNSYSYTYDPDTTGITVFADLNAYQVGTVTWGGVTKLVKVTPGEKPVGTEYEVGYKFTSCITSGAPGDTVTSTLEREYIGNIYQIIPLPEANSVVLVRDKIDALADAGSMENIPYLVAEVRDYQNPSVIIETFALNDNSLETVDDVQRRVYKQYNATSGMLLGPARGCLDMNGFPQVVFTLNVMRQSDNTLLNRALRLWWQYGPWDPLVGVIPSFDLIYFDTDPPVTSNPLLAASWNGAAFVGGKTIFPTAHKLTSGYDGWASVVRGNS